MQLDPGQLRAFLAEADVPCPSCDYNLRGLTGDRCPECNQRLVLRVGLAEPRQRAFIATVVALAMGAGFHGLLLMYFVFRSFFDQYVSGEMAKFMVLTAPFLLIEGAALVVLVRLRRQFQRRPAGFKGWVVAAACLVTLTGFLLFTLFIR
jgi:hypothetical protein